MLWFDKKNDVIFEAIIKFSVVPYVCELCLLLILLTEYVSCAFHLYLISKVNDSFAVQVSSSNV